MRRILTAYERVAVWHLAAPPIGDVIDTGALYRNALAHWDNATDDEREQGRQWYPSAREWLRNLSGATNRDYARSAAMMAALSPRQDWDTNLATGAHFLLNYDPAQKQRWLHTDPRNPARQTGTGMSGLGENILRAMRIHDAHPDDVLTELGNGPKVNNFYRNFMGDDDAVTIDTHIARALNTAHGGPFAETGPATAPLGWQRDGQWAGYETYADAIRKAAAERGVSPAEMQATIWVKFKNDLDRDRELQKNQTWERRHPGKPQPPGHAQRPRPLGPLRFPIPDYTKESDDPRLPAPHPVSAPGYHHPLGGVA